MGQQPTRGQRTQWKPEKHAGPANGDGPWTLPLREDRRQDGQGDRKDECSCDAHHRPHRDQTIGAQGAKLSAEESIAYAARGRGERRRPTTGWASLTPSELAVVRLVGQHLSNPEIASRLFVSRATVKTHLVHVFSKLGIDSRSEVAAGAIKRGITRPPEQNVPK